MVLLPGSALALSVGEPAPDIILPDESGQPVRLFDLLGQFVYVDFWASWCGPCRQSFPWMNQLSMRSEMAALNVLAINVDENLGDASVFLRRNPAQFTVLYDPTGRVAANYQLPGMPTSFLIGPDGRIRWRHIGFRPGDGQKIESLIMREMRKP